MKKKDRLPIFRQRLNELLGDMTTTEFAKKVGLSRQTMGFYLNGDRIPDSAILIQICKTCNVSADYLLGLSADDGGKRTATAIPICKEISQLFPEKLEEMRKRLSKALDMILYFQQAMKEQTEKPEE